MSAADSMIPSSAEAKAALRRICSASRSASGGFASSFPAEAAVSSPDGRREEEGLLPSAARPLSPCVSRSLPLPLLNARLLRPSFCCFSLDGVDGAHERGNASRCSRALQWLAEGGPAFARLLVREETPLAESDFAAESTAEEEDHPMGSWQYVLEDENWAGFIVQSKRRSFSSICDGLRRVDLGGGADEASSDSRSSAQDLTQELVAMADFHLSLLYSAVVVIQKQRALLQRGRDQLHANSQEWWHCVRDREAAVQKLAEELSQTQEQIALVAAEAAEERRKAAAAAEELARMRSSLSETQRERAWNSSLRHVDELNKRLDAIKAERDQFAEQLKKLTAQKQPPLEAQPPGRASGAACADLAKREFLGSSVRLCAADDAADGSGRACVSKEGEAEEAAELPRRSVRGEGGAAPKKNEAAGTFLPEGEAEATTAESSGASSRGSSSLASSRVSTASEQPQPHLQLQGGLLEKHPSLATSLGGGRSAGLSLGEELAAAAQDAPCAKAPSATASAADDDDGLSSPGAPEPSSYPASPSPPAEEREMPKSALSAAASSGHSPSSLEPTKPSTTASRRRGSSAENKEDSGEAQTPPMAQQQRPLRPRRRRLFQVACVLAAAVALMAALVFGVLHAPLLHRIPSGRKAFAFAGLSQPLSHVWHSVANLCAAALAEQEEKLRLQIEAFAWAATGG